MTKTLLSAIVAIAATALRFVVRRTVIQASLAWALLAALLGLHGTGPASTVYLATGGLVLNVSLIETSHRMAFSDELTGLPSRRALTDALMRLPEMERQLHRVALDARHAIGPALLIDRVVQFAAEVLQIGRFCRVEHALDYEPTNGSASIPPGGRSRPRPNGRWPIV